MDKEVKEFINQEQQKHTKLTRVEKTDINPHFKQQDWNPFLKKH